MPDSVRTVSGSCSASNVAETETERYLRQIKERLDRPNPDKHFTNDEMVIIATFLHLRQAQCQTAIAGASKHDHPALAKWSEGTRSYWAAVSKGIDWMITTLRPRKHKVR